MLEVGAVAPEFEGPASDGRPFRLRDHRGRPVVVYFFPKAFTAGCTRETRGFAGIAGALRDRGVTVVGVSVDPGPTQARFAAHCGADFPLVADPDRSIARAFGVLSVLGFARRVTFFLDADGTVRDVVVGLRPGPHLDRTRARHLGDPGPTPADRPGPGDGRPPPRQG